MNIYSFLPLHTRRLMLNPVKWLFDKRFLLFIFTFGVYSYGLSWQKLCGAINRSNIDKINSNVSYNLRHISPFGTSLYCLCSG